MAGQARNTKPFFRRRPAACPRDPVKNYIIPGPRGQAAGRRALGTEVIDVPYAPRKNRSRFAFATTVTDDIAIAAPAINGFNSKPITGYNTPAAIGIPKLL
jgi:hypothetical protein